MHGFQVDLYGQYFSEDCRGRCNYFFTISPLSFNFPVSPLPNPHFLSAVLEPPARTHSVPASARIRPVFCPERSCLYIVKHL